MFLILWVKTKVFKFRTTSICLIAQAPCIKKVQGARSIPQKQPAVFRSFRPAPNRSFAFWETYKFCLPNCCRINRLHFGSRLVKLNLAQDARRGLQSLSCTDFYSRSCKVQLDYGHSTDVCNKYILCKAQLTRPAILNPFFSQLTAGSKWWWHPFASLGFQQVTWVCLQPSPVSSRSTATCGSYLFGWWTVVA